MTVMWFFTSDAHKICLILRSVHYKSYLDALWWLHKSIWQWIASLYIIFLVYIIDNGNFLPFWGQVYKLIIYIEHTRVPISYWYEDTLCICTTNWQSLMLVLSCAHIAFLPFVPLTPKSRNSSSATYRIFHWEYSTH